MPDFSTIDNPTVPDRLSYWGRQVQKSMDEYNAALPEGPGGDWRARHIDVGKLFSEAQRDARLSIHNNGEPQWTVDANIVKDGEVTWHPALNKDNDGDVLCYLFRAQQLSEKHEPAVEQTPEVLKIFDEVDIAENKCRKSRSWD